MLYIITAISITSLGCHKKQGKQRYPNLNRVQNLPLLLSLQRDHAEYWASPAVPHIWNIFAERINLHPKSKKCAAFNTWGFCMALQLSALLQHEKQGKDSLLLKKCCMVNPWWSESPQPARGIALSWKSLRNKDNLPLQTPGGRDDVAAGGAVRIWFKAVTGDGDFPTEAAAACGTARKIGGGHSKPGDICLVLTTVCSQEQSCATWVFWSKHASLVRDSKRKFKVSWSLQRTASMQLFPAWQPCTVLCHLYMAIWNKYALCATITLFFSFRCICSLTFQAIWIFTDV